MIYRAYSLKEEFQASQFTDERLPKVKNTARCFSTGTTLFHFVIYFGGFSLLFSVLLY
jgi:hypothetical protein